MQMSHKARDREREVDRLTEERVEKRTATIFENIETCSMKCYKNIVKNYENQAECEKNHTKLLQKTLQKY